MATTPDRIVKQVLLRAPRERVWNAVSRAEEFGVWFGLEAEGEFVAGTTVECRMVPTQMDEEIAAYQEPYRGMAFDLYIEEVDPLRRLSFRWHPGAEPDMGEGAPTTLVSFELEDAEGGTLLTVTESGFDRFPPERRAKVFEDNAGGWEVQARLIATYLDRARR